MGARNAVGGSIEPSQSVQNPIPFCAIWVAHNIDIGSLDWTNCFNVPEETGIHVNSPMV